VTVPRSCLATLANLTFHPSHARYSSGSLSFSAAATIVLRLPFPVQRGEKNLLKLATSGNLCLSNISSNSGSALLILHPQLHALAVAAEVHDQDTMFQYQAGQRRSVKHLDHYSGAAATVAVGRRVSQKCCTGSVGDRVLTSGEPRGDARSRRDDPVSLWRR
jgi:hypothetical protein